MTASSTLALSTTDLKKSFGRQMALAGLDLEVPTGVVYGFLGPNGAGKTTTMRILTGLIHPDSGSVSLLGQAFGRAKRRLLQDVGALSNRRRSTRTYRPATTFVFAATGRRCRRLASRSCSISSACASGRAIASPLLMGMRQRLGIAVALLNDPKLLLLDEPANGLDPSGIVGLRDTLKTLAASGKTVFISSHILPEVQQMADIVGIVAAGRLVTQGPLDELLASQALVRVRVRPDEAAKAFAMLSKLAGERSRRDHRCRGGLADGPSGRGSRRRGEPHAGQGRDLCLGPRGRQRPRIALPAVDRAS